MAAGFGGEKSNGVKENHSFGRVSTGVMMKSLQYEPPYSLTTVIWHAWVPDNGGVERTTCRVPCVHAEARNGN